MKAVLVDRDGNHLRVVTVENEGALPEVIMRQVPAASGPPGYEFFVSMDEDDEDGDPMYEVAKVGTA